MSEHVDTSSKPSPTIRALDLWSILQKIEDQMTQIQGFCEDRFSNLRALLQSRLDSGQELGASLTVEIDGKPAADLWGGYLDESRTREWQSDSVVVLWSTTKTVCSIAALLAVDRGLLDLGERVCTYWPEFAAGGKDQVPVRQILSHTSGVPAWTRPVSLEEIYDLEESTARLTRQPPWWTPGTASGYHGMSYGHLIEALISRTTGKSLKQFVADELAGPLKADIQLGLQPADYSRRAATVVPPAPRATPRNLDPNSVMAKTHGAPAVDASAAATKAFRDAEFGAGGGNGNGRSIARILSPIALEGIVDGTKYLSTKTIDQVFQVQSHGDDLVLGSKICLGTGFGLPRKDTYWDWAPTNGRVCGWGGWGGSMGIVDADRRMNIGYAMNKMHDVGMGSECTKAYVAEIYRCLGLEV